MDFKRELYRFDSGLRLVFIKTEGYHTARIKITFEVGAEDEEKPTGMAHLVEHTIFKGTTKYSQEEISERFDALSADVNAYTSSEFTTYKANFPKRNLEKVLNLYSHILKDSAFDSEMIKKEKQVILEEIMMHEDNPDQLAFDNIVKLMYSDIGIGNDIAGEVLEFNKVTKETVFKFYKEHYHSANMLVSVIGDFEFKTVIEMVDKYLSSPFKKKGVVKCKQWSKKSKTKPKSKVVYKDINQANILLGFKTMSHIALERIDLGIIGFILGGSMSSRLFKKIRNELSLCYSVYGFEINYANNGFFGISLATSPQKSDVAISAVNEEIMKIIENGVTDEEFENSKNLMLDKHLMNQDLPNAGLHYLSYTNKLVDMEVLTNYIKGVTKESALEVFRKYIHPNKEFISIVTNKN